MKLSATFAALLATVSLSGVQAHTIFQQLYVNGVSPGHNIGIRVASTNNPVTDVTSNDVIVRHSSRHSFRVKLTVFSNSAILLWYAAVVDEGVVY